MAKSWYLMTRPLFDSGYEKEEFNAYARDGFAELLDSLYLLMWNFIKQMILLLLKKLKQ